MDSSIWCCEGCGQSAFMELSFEYQVFEDRKVVELDFYQVRSLLI